MVPPGRMPLSGKGFNLAGLPPYADYLTRHAGICLPERYLDWGDGIRSRGLAVETWIGRVNVSLVANEVGAVVLILSRRRGRPGTEEEDRYAKLRLGSS